MFMLKPPSMRLPPHNPMVFTYGRRTHSSANSFRRRKSTEQQESCMSKQTKDSQSKMLPTSVICFRCISVPPANGKTRCTFSLCLEGSLFKRKRKMHNESTRFSHTSHKNEASHLCFHTQTWKLEGIWCFSRSWFLFFLLALNLNHLKDAPRIRRIPGLLRFVGQFRFCLCDLLLIEVWEPRLLRACWNLSSCDPRGFLIELSWSNEISIFNFCQVSFCFWSNAIVDNEYASCQHGWRYKFPWWLEFHLCMYSI